MAKYWKGSKSGLESIKSFSALGGPVKLCLLEEEMGEGECKIRKGSNEVAIEIGKPKEHLE
jgi:hypothetical protein